MTNNIDFDDFSFLVQKNCSIGPWNKYININKKER